LGAKLREATDMEERMAAIEGHLAERERAGH
jgi:hypothetical protein